VPSSLSPYLLFSVIFLLLFLLCVNIKWTRLTKGAELGCRNFGTDMILG
jgi:hypothetical protein